MQKLIVIYEKKIRRLIFAQFLYIENLVFKIVIQKIMVGLLKTIFVIILFYYLFKYIGRLLLPVLLKKGVEKMQQNQYRQYNGGGDNNYQNQQEKGKVTITNSAQKKRTNPSQDQGEYVDFEEIK